MVTVTIDGQIIQAYEGESVLEAARRHDIFIPALCFLEGLSVAGSCRMCLVEINGKVVTACSTPARSGMEIETRTEALRRQQRMLLKMLFASGQHICAVCEANGACELQALAQRLGVTELSFGQRRPVQKVDLSHERFGFDPNRCILCTRCIRTCNEIEGAGVWVLQGQGCDSRIVPSTGENWAAAVDCTKCGKCVFACPTGALFDKRVSTAEMKKDCGLLARLKEHREKI